MEVIYQVCSYVSKETTWDSAYYATKELLKKKILKKLISLNLFFPYKSNNSYENVALNVSTLNLLKYFYRIKLVNTVLLPSLFDFFSSLFFVEKCNIFHCWAGHGLYSIKKAKKIGCKVVLECASAHILQQCKILKEEYQIWDLEFNENKLNILKLITEYKISDYILVPSIYVKNSFLKEKFPEEKIKVINYGIDLREIKTNNYNQDKFKIIYTGAIILRKGLQYLLLALKNLKLKDTELIIIGNVEKKIRKILSNLTKEVQIPIKFFNRLPKKLYYLMLANSSLYIFPSLEDGWAMTVLEAMASGLPIITTKNVGASEIIENGKEGFVVNIRDVNSIRDHILYFYENPSEVKRMGENARKKASQYSWEKFVNNLVKFYEEIS